jgi:hypothetical protein
MRKTVARADAAPYRREISARLWEIAGILGAHLDWATADATVALAMRAAGARGLPAGQPFNALCRVSPRLAMRAREWLIRLAKPDLRQNYPGWRRA